MKQLVSIPCFDCKKEFNQMVETSVMFLKQKIVCPNCGSQRINYHGVKNI